MDYEKAILLGDKETEEWLKTADASWCRNLIEQYKYESTKIYKIGNKQKKPSKAIYYYNKAIELNPNFDHAYYMRATAKYELKDYSGALEDYNKAIELNPKYADIFYNRGIIETKLKDYSGALEGDNKSK